VVRTGKIRHGAFWDLRARVPMKAATTASERRASGPIVKEVGCSPVAREAGMGIMPWSPLAGGFPTRKSARGQTGGKCRPGDVNPIGDGEFTDRDRAVLDVLGEVAKEPDCMPARAALALAMARPDAGSTLVGARMVAHLKASVAAEHTRLGVGRADHPNTASAATPGFPTSLAAPMIRKMIHGGKDVTGWGEWRDRRQASFRTHALVPFGAGLHRRDGGRASFLATTDWNVSRPASPASEDSSVSRRRPPRRPFAAARPPGPDT
jgi:hypothetical protein